MTQLAHTKYRDIIAVDRWVDNVIHVVQKEEVWPHAQLTEQYVLLKTYTLFQDGQNSGNTFVTHILLWDRR